MSERSEANDCVPFEILLCIYISIFIYIYEYIYVCPQHERRWQKRADYASGCCSSASFDDGCTLRYIALKLHSTLFSFLRRRYAARRLDFAIAGTLPPTLCCALVQCAVASC